MTAKSTGQLREARGVRHAPGSRTSPAPVQVANNIQSRPAISPAVHAARPGGSDVVQGNIQLIPIGNSIFYVRPIYVRARRTATAATFRLRRRRSRRARGARHERHDVVATLDGHTPPLNDLFNGGDQPPTPTTTPTTTPRPRPTPTRAPRRPARAERVQPTAASSLAEPGLAPTQVDERRAAALAATASLVGTYHARDITAAHARTSPPPSRPSPPAAEPRRPRPGPGIVGPPGDCYYLGSGNSRCRATPGRRPGHLRPCRGANRTWRSRASIWASTSSAGTTPSRLRLSSPRRA